jgi:hypothetical protein
MDHRSTIYQVRRKGRTQALNSAQWNLKTRLYSEINENRRKKFRAREFKRPIMDNSLQAKLAKVEDDHYEQAETDSH